MARERPSNSGLDSFHCGVCVRRVFVWVLLACSAIVSVALRAQDATRSAVGAAAPRTGAPSARAATKPLPSRAPAPPAPITPASVKGFESVVKPFVSEFCYPCHGNKGEAKNGLNIQSFETVGSLINQRNHWEDIVGMLKRSEMPPMEEEQPEEKRRQAVATWVERELARIDRVTPPDPGRVTARRLNRAEYNNTIRELLGVELAAG